MLGVLEAVAVVLMIKVEKMTVLEVEEVLVVPYSLSQMMNFPLEEQLMQLEVLEEITEVIPQKLQEEEEDLVVEYSFKEETLMLQVVLVQLMQLEVLEALMAEELVETDVSE